MALNPMKTLPAPGEQHRPVRVHLRGQPRRCVPLHQLRVQRRSGRRDFRALKAIEREAIKSKGREMGGSFNITVPRTLSWPSCFKGPRPRRVILIRIWEGDVPEFDTPAELGAAPAARFDLDRTCLESQHKEQTTLLSCDNLGAGMKRPGLHRFYQRECPFALFGTRCGASKAAASTTLTVFGQDPTDRTIGVDWLTETGFTDDQKENHIGGLVEFTGPHGTEPGGGWRRHDEPRRGQPVGGLISGVRIRLR